MLFKRSDARRREFEREMEQAYPSLLATCLRLTHNRDEGEDLAQESLVRAYEAFDRFDGSNFKAWILRIATNLYINRYRQRRRNPSGGSIDDENFIEPADDESLVPDRALFDVMLEGEIEDALRGVPEDFRLAVILSDIEGLSYQEISEMMDIPLGTVRSRLARGRAHLRKKLERFARERGYLRAGSEG